MLQYLKYVSQQRKARRNVMRFLIVNAFNHYLFHVTMQQGTEHSLNLPQKKLPEEDNCEPSNSN